GPAARLVEQLALGEGGREAERALEPDAGGDGGVGERVEALVAERVEHRAALVGLGAEVAAGEAVGVGEGGGAEGGVHRGRARGRAAGGYAGSAGPASPSRAIQERALHAGLRACRRARYRSASALASVASPRRRASSASRAASCSACFF